MILSFDFWHRGWGFGFTVVIWERSGDEDYETFQLLGLDFQVKLFGRELSREWGEMEWIEK